MKIAAIQMVSGTGVQANLTQRTGCWPRRPGRAPNWPFCPSFLHQGACDTDKLKVRECWQWPDPDF
jgi:hypothetical protein